MHKKGKGVWVCPADSYKDWYDEYLFAEGGDDRDKEFARTYMSYWPNRQFFNASWGTCYRPENPARPVASVERPSSTIMTGDGIASWLLPYLPGVPHSREDIKRRGAWHGWRANFLFADGHVKHLSFRQTLRPAVLWDNLRDWCPECSCAQQEGWSPKDIEFTLKELDRVGYPDQ